MGVRALAWRARGLASRIDRRWIACTINHCQRLFRRTTLQPISSFQCHSVGLARFGLARQIGSNQPSLLSYPSRIPPQRHRARDPSTIHPTAVGNPRQTHIGEEVTNDTRRSNEFVSLRNSYENKRHLQAIPLQMQVPRVVYYSAVIYS